MLLSVTDVHATVLAMTFDGSSTITEVVVEAGALDGSCSLAWRLPAGVDPPTVGDQVEVEWTMIPVQPATVVDPPRDDGEPNPSRDRRSARRAK